MRTPTPMAFTAAAFSIAALTAVTGIGAPACAQSTPTTSTLAVPQKIAKVAAGRSARTFSMLNGMKVTLIHAGADARALVALELGTGEIDEPAFGPGLAAIAARMLLEGTLARSASQIGAEAAGLGGALSVTAGAVTTSLSGEVGTPNIARFVSLLSDVVRHPLLDTAGFERVRRSTLLSIDSTLKQARNRAMQEWRAMVFPNHPFGHPFTHPATLAALQLGHVRNVYDENYGAARAHLYVSGMFDDDEIEHAVRDAFSDWKAGIPAVAHPAAPVAQRQFTLVDWAGAPRSAISAGVPVVDPASADFVKLEIVNALFGASLESAGPVSFRPDAATPVGAAIWQRSGASYWADFADVSADSTGAALDNILGQVDRFRNETPSDSELTRVKQAVIARFNAMAVSREGIVSQLAYVYEHGLGEPWLADYANRVTAVSAQDVREMALKYLDPARMTITVVGDRATVEPQVARFRGTPPTP